MDDRNWLAKELKKTRKSRKRAYASYVIAAGVVILLAVLIYSKSHSKSVNLTDNQSSGQNGSLQVVGSPSSSATQPTTSSKQAAPTTPSQPPPLPTILTSADASIFTKTFNDAEDYAGAVSGLDTDVLPPSAQALSDDIQTIKDINLNKYAFSTGSTIISIESNIIIADNEYTQAYADASQAAELNNDSGLTQSEVDEVNNDNLQKQSDITNAGESIQSAQTALIGIELPSH